MHKLDFMQVFFLIFIYSFAYYKNMLLTKPNSINSLGFFILD